MGSRGARIKSSGGSVISTASTTPTRTLLTGQQYQNEYMNIFIVGITSDTVRFIEGYSPAAIHSIQEIPKDNLDKYLTEHEYKLIGYYK